MLHVVGGAGTSGVWLAVKDIDFRLEARGVEGLGGRDVPPLITMDPPHSTLLPPTASFLAPPSSVKACVKVLS